ncbi:MAG TPA: glucose-1-phosphate adenylyltransferase, partial [Ruminococcaceae bacterium]|nr:glucose-1-phosphate adenylyltransferase [Oscillospiraceae bacterium]
QYQPLVLNEYIGSGQPWDLDRQEGGVFVLPPYQKSSGSDWYTGTANAIYQNLPFIERYDPEYVLILSGDHIYKMDYEKMLKFHKEKEADCTIAVLQVPMEEASRFGIMNAYDDGQIYEFEEKPANPKSNLASMGIYIFSWNKLREYLEQDAKTPGSANDFGKNIIPNMLAAHERMYAYAFDGYWKDVGTIDSLWEANMDLLDPKVPLSLYDPEWKIYARNPALPPHYIAPGAVVQNSMITEGCVIEGTVDFSVIFAGVTIEEGAVVRDSIIMPGSVVKKGAVVDYTIVAEQAVIGENAVIGARPEKMENISEWGVTVIGNGVTIGAGVNIAPKSMVETDITAEEVQGK